MKVEGFEINVTSFNEFMRGPGGSCAFCKGDPCNEFPKKGSVISRFYEENPLADTCPVCDGRPT